MRFVLECRVVCKCKAVLLFVHVYYFMGVLFCNSMLHDVGSSVVTHIMCDWKVYVQSVPKL